MLPLNEARTNECTKAAAVKTDASKKQNVFSPSSPGECHKTIPSSPILSERNLELSLRSQELYNSSSEGGSAHRLATIL